MTSQSRVDVLIPTCNRPAALAVTLTALFAQNFPSLRVVVSDQGEAEACAAGEVRAMARLLASRGVAIELHRHLPRRGLAGLIRGYQLAISPALPPSCRFTPSCSQYALEAVRRYGALKGVWLAARRLARCHPFHRGGFDPVP